MTKRHPTNLAASVFQRLLNLRREQDQDFELILKRYALERLLYRLGNSDFASRFVLKGAMLFGFWAKRMHRPTKDLDLLGYGDLSAQQIREIFQALCRLEVEPDGLLFDAASIRVAEIREDQEYQGRRVRLTTRLENARIICQIDVGLGDVVTPAAQEIVYPTLLDFPAPRIRAYPPETMIAEKLQALVALGLSNSRMKDLYDLWVIARQFSFDGDVLVRAIQATFEHRKTAIPAVVPSALGDEFPSDRDKAIQWKAFLRKGRLEDGADDLPDVVRLLRSFLAPPLLAAARGGRFHEAWADGGPWKSRN